MQKGRSIGAIEAMCAATASATIAIGAKNAFTDRLYFINGNLLVGKAMRNPLIVFVAMLATKMLLVPPK